MPKPVSEMTDITTAKFEKLLKEQTPEHDTKKWGDLEINKNMHITSTKIVESQNGESMILSLLNNGEIWAPNHLKDKILNGEDKHELLFYIRPRGLKPCKKNPRNKYHTYDLVFDDGPKYQSMYT